MNGRSLVILAVAVGIGLGAMVMTRKLLFANKGGKVDETDVLVAARDVKAEEILKSDMVKVISMAKSAVPVGSFSAYSEVPDRWVKNVLLEGDVLVEKKLGPKGTPPGLVANIPQGMRAYAIDVTEQSGVSGFILPGHHVDVIRHESNDKNERQAETILQDVLVLAAGQMFTRQDERSVQSRTVTLALKPTEVDILVAARTRGSLALALRGVNDHDLLTRKAAKPAIDPEHENRLKLEEQKRITLEEQLRDLKAALAKKSAPPLPAAPTRTPRIATIYRGLQNAQRIRTDRSAATEQGPTESPAFPDGTASLTPDGSGEVKVVTGGNQTGP